MLDVYEAAAHDELTGTLLRRPWRARAEREVSRARFGSDSALLIIDVDYLKRHNDRFGHLAGDRVLAEAVRTIRFGLRHVDLIGRFGGDEIVVLLLEIQNLRQAQSIAERLRRKVAKLTVQLPSTVPGVPGQKIAEISVSIGAATALRGAASLEQLLAAADAALYEAKQTEVISARSAGRRK